MKAELHPRNRHRQGYDFLQLAQTLPDLAPYIRQNQYGNLSVDFADPRVVKLLNKALLLQFYQLSYWDIPDNYLCPPVPGRVDYIHYLADLLADDNHGQLLRCKGVRVLDIGVGANAIYPIVGHAEYGWSFVGSDINPQAINVANVIAKSNPALKSALQCRLQTDSAAIFHTIIKPKDYFTFTLCNPPFYTSAQEADASNHKKVSNLTASQPQKSPVRNFAGQQSELWCPGGERAFISQMIIESQDYAQQCLWFSSLVAKKDSLTLLMKTLQKVNPAEVKVIEMAQGQKISRFIAWTFIPQAQRHAFLVKHRMVMV
ncbi:23S rRNA (adenine(1618)-N(6))-methyltransferase RlmF [Utexia brackfieldae]|uniref:23S rRNA (adenine(1618)-N(6))-methyltransferase RlmF n=1 Tax=Utexia brackfieldae TaxID=3074108 RepID=UPI00370DBE7A